VRAVAKAAPPLTENSLVAAIRETLAQSPRAKAMPRLRVEIGDDAAAWKPNPHHLCVITTDMLIDGVHFRLQHAGPEAAGHKALAKNLSDLAAMGAAPKLAVVALGVTADIDEPLVRGLYRGIAALAAATRCTIAGGDIVRAPALTLAITVVGEARKTRLRLRSGAQPGDVIALTGPIGLASAGLRVLDAGRERTLSAAAARNVVAAYLTPTPRLPEGSYLGTRRACRALMDLSDGLSSDLARMASASRVAAVVRREALVADPSLLEAAAVVAGIDPLDCMLNGGDDYELLAAIEPRAFRHVARGFAARFRRKLTPIGNFEEGEGGVWLQSAGKRAALPAAGWDHLRRP